MLKTLVIAIAALALLAGPAMAGQCPLLMKQLNDAADKMKADDPNVKKGKELIATAKKQHDEGKHADSVKTCEEAAKVLKVKLEMKKM